MTRWLVRIFGDAHQLIPQRVVCVVANDRAAAQRRAHQLLMAHETRVEIMRRPNALGLDFFR